jgi:hypothetical protein
MPATSAGMTSMPHPHAKKSPARRRRESFSRFFYLTLLLLRAGLLAATLLLLRAGFLAAALLAGVALARILALLPGLLLRLAALLLLALQLLLLHPVHSGLRSWLSTIRKLPAAQRGS